jgi:hypothetical protein
MKRLVWSVLLLAGCTSYATEPAAPVAAAPELARICVVRPSSLAFAAPAAVYDNGGLVGVTDPVSYFCYLAEPGGHAIKSFLGDDIDRTIATGDTARATIAVEAGRSYFLEQEVGALGVHRLAWIDEARAGELIAGCAPVRVVAAPDDERLPQPNDVAPALAVSD